jgi:hypothetical protein
MMQHKLKVQNKIKEDLKYFEMISFKAAMYEIKEKETNQKMYPK